MKIIIELVLLMGLSANTFTMYSLDDICIKYLEALGFENTIPKPTFESLILLQKNHIHTFSHDTIDTYFKCPISLNPKKIIMKFLSEKRGGLCFELNGAFIYLLKQLGFQVKLVSADVHRVGRQIFNYSIDTHAVIIVSIDQQEYLVDVGFAHSVRAPVKLDNNVVQDISGEFKVSYDIITRRYGFFKKFDNDWFLQYSFTLEPKELIDFKHNLDFVYHSPDHWFNSNLICTLPTETGYLMLSCLKKENAIKRKLVIKNTQGRKETGLVTLSEVKELLISKFKMSSEFIRLLNE